jgi:hypothetical protein
VDAHVTRDPLDRDLRRRQLARRLVIHQARTKTIFLLTGLSRHQMATLRQRWRIGDEMRRRGPPPTSFAVLLSTLRMRAEVAALAVFWKALGSFSRADGLRAHEPASNVDLGERICDVFEVYLACFPTTELELEHLVLLARGLHEENSIGVAKCSDCKAAMLIDLFGMQRRICSHCQRAVDAMSASNDAVSPSQEPISSPASTGEGIQQKLF